MPNENFLGALSMIAHLHAVDDVLESDGHYIVMFEGTTATLVISTKEVTLDEIRETIEEARS